MAWRIEVSAQAAKQLAGLDKRAAKRIIDKLDEIATLGDPHATGRALTGNLSGLWRYRVGDYRIVCDIEHDVLVILVIAVDHRSRIYRTKR